MLYAAAINALNFGASIVVSATQLTSREILLLANATRTRGAHLTVTDASLLDELTLQGIANAAQERLTLAFTPEPPVA